MTADIISIHAPRVGSDSAPMPNILQATISIHAPRVGIDSPVPGIITGSPVISIHAPRVGSDIASANKIVALAEFQSTLPVWGATHMYRETY